MQSSTQKKMKTVLHYVASWYVVHYFGAVAYNIYSRCGHNVYIIDHAPTYDGGSLQDLQSEVKRNSNQMFHQYHPDCHIIYSNNINS